MSQPLKGGFGTFGSGSSAFGQTGGTTPSSGLFGSGTGAGTGTAAGTGTTNAFGGPTVTSAFGKSAFGMFREPAVGDLC